MPWLSKYCVMYKVILVSNCDDNSIDYKTQFDATKAFILFTAWWNRVHRYDKEWKDRDYFLIHISDEERVSCRMRIIASTANTSMTCYEAKKWSLKEICSVYRIKISIMKVKWINYFFNNAYKKSLLMFNIFIHFYIS